MRSSFKGLQVLLLSLILLGFLVIQGWAFPSLSSFLIRDIRVTPQGRVHLLEIYPRAGTDNTLTILIIATQHGDEPAGTLALIDLIEKEFWEKYPNLHLILLYPFNPYGYEENIRYDAYYRDLNRNWLSLSYEPQRVVADLLGRSDFLIDLHEARKRPDRDYMYSFPSFSIPEEMRVYEALAKEIKEALPSLRVKPYYALRKDSHKVKGGFPTYRILRNYAYLRGNLAVLLESTRSFPLKERVRAHERALESILRWLSAHPDEVRRAIAVRKEAWKKEPRFCIALPDYLADTLDRHGLSYFYPSPSYVRVKYYEITSKKLRTTFGLPCWELSLREHRGWARLGGHYKVYPSWALVGSFPQGKLLKVLTIPQGRCESIWEDPQNTPWTPRYFKPLPIYIIAEEDCQEMLRNSLLKI